MVCGRHGIHGRSVQKIAKNMEKQAEKNIVHDNVIILHHLLMETTVLVKSRKKKVVMSNNAKVKYKNKFENQTVYVDF